LALIVPYDDSLFWISADSNKNELEMEWLWMPELT